MVTFADACLSSSSRPLEVRRRPDLECVEQRYQGRSSWVVKDPLGLRYVRLLEKEYAILSWLDGRRSLDEIVEMYHRRFAPESIALTELQQFVGRLHRDGLVAATSAAQGKQLLMRRGKRRSSRFWAAVTNPFSIRFRGIDPGFVLERLYPLVRWTLHPASLALCGLLMLAALLLVTLKYDVFQSRLPAFHDFFGPKNWLLLALVLSFTKLVHELGHGLACRHFGRECHEIGLLLLVFTPCLYCNVSDSWMLASKWQRAAIGAAGMFVELTLAALATFAWWYSEPGPFNFLCLQIMFVSSVSTVFFNGNPLLKYDGYFILSDLVEIPNLREKASAILRRLLQRWCLGIEQPLDPFMPQRHHLLFALYAVAAEVYRWVVVFSILWFLNEVLEPYGLKVLGQTAAVVSLALMGGKAMWGLAQFFRVPSKVHQMKRTRVFLSLATIGVLLAGVFLVPLPRYAGCPLETRFSSAATVYVPVASRVVEVLVAPGQRVEAGQVLARCESLDLELKIARLQGEEKAYQAQLASLQQQRFTDAGAGAEIASVAEALLAVAAQREQQLHWQKLLTLRAPRSGVVLAPVRQKQRPKENQTLPNWHGTLLAGHNRTAVVEAGAVFCQIGDPAAVEAELYVDQGDVEQVSVGQPVTMRLDARPHERWEATLESLAKREVQFVSPSLAHQAGGSLAVRTDASGQARPLGAVYTARVPLANGGGTIPGGARGWARVTTGSQTLAERLLRWIAHTFRFEV